MKFSIFGVLFLAAGLGLAQNAPTKLTEYGSKDMGFSIKYPVGWSTSEKLAGGVMVREGRLFYSSRPPDGDEEDHLPGSPCSESVEDISLFLDFPRPVKTETYLKTYLEFLREKYTKSKYAQNIFHYKVVKTGTLNAGGTDGNYIVYGYAPGDCTGRIQYIAFLFTKGDKAYSLVCETCPQRFKEYSKMFFEIAKSLVLYD